MGASTLVVNQECLSEEVTWMEWASHVNIRGEMGGKVFLGRVNSIMYSLYTMYTQVQRPLGKNNPPKQHQNG